MLADKKTDCQGRRFREEKVQWVDPGNPSLVISETIERTLESSVLSELLEKPQTYHLTKSDQEAEVLAPTTFPQRPDFFATIETIMGYIAKSSEDYKASRMINRNLLINCTIQHGLPGIENEPAVQRLIDLKAYFFANQKQYGGSSAAQEVGKEFGDHKFDIPTIERSKQPRPYVTRQTKARINKLCEGLTLDKSTIAAIILCNEWSKLPEECLARSIREDLSEQVRTFFRHLMLRQASLAAKIEAIPAIDELMEELILKLEP